MMSNRETEIQLMTQAAKRHSSLMEDLCSDKEVLSVMFRAPNKQKDDRPSALVCGSSA